MIQVRKQSRYILEKKKIQNWETVSVGISMAGNKKILQKIQRHYSKELNNTHYNKLICKYNLMHPRILLSFLCKRRYQINWKWKINLYCKSMFIL